MKLLKRDFFCFCVSLYKSNLHSLRFGAQTSMLDLWFTFSKFVMLCAGFFLFVSSNIFDIFIVWKHSALCILFTFFVGFYLLISL